MASLVSPVLVYQLGLGNFPVLGPSVGVRNRGSWRARTHTHDHEVGQVEVEESRSWVASC